MKYQINASKFLHSSAMYIKSMKITRSLCKKLLMIKSVNFFTPSINCEVYNNNKWFLYSAYQKR